MCFQWEKTGKGLWLFILDKTRRKQCGLGFVGAEIFHPPHG